VDRSEVVALTRHLESVEGGRRNGLDGTVLEPLKAVGAEQHQGSCSATYEQIARVSTLSPATRRRRHGVARGGAPRSGAAAVGAEHTQGVIVVATELLADAAAFFQAAAEPLLRVALCLGAIDLVLARL
jgi:hypothetical protein